MSFPFSIEQTEEGKKTPINNAGNSYSRLTFPAGSVSFNLPDQVVQPQDMSEGNILTKLVMPVKIKSHRNENDLVLEGEWRYSQKTMDEIINLGDQIRISKIPFRPNHIKSGGEIKKMKNMLTPSHYGMATNEDATAMLTEIFGGKDVFDNPKPVELLKTLTKAVTYMDEGALVVDFFAGTGTMAHAVLDLNREDDGYRQFILVQLPELSPTDSPAFEAGYHSIADIGKERIRRSVKKLQKENPDGIENQDFGFKVLKLTSSHYKPWQNYHGESVEELESLFESYAEPLVENWRESEDGLFTEILLLEGFPLDSTVTELSGYTANRLRLVTCDYHENRVIVCLDDALSPETVQQLNLTDGDTFVCLDTAVDDKTKARLADKGLIKTI